MSISKKIIAIFFITLLLFWVANFVIQKSLVLPSFAEVERRHAQVNIQRIEELLWNTIDQLERLTYDWSAWDDTYDFAQEPNQSYIESNLHPETFGNLLTDIVLITNSKPELIWGNLYDFTGEEAKVIESKNAIDSMFSLFSSLYLEIQLEEPADKQLTSGIVVHDRKAIIYAIRTILNSNGEGPSAGFLMMAKTLTQPVLDSIQAQLKIDFDLDIITHTKQNKYIDKQYKVEYITDQLLQISKTHFSNDQPVFTLSTEFPRDITQSGLRSVHYALMTLLLVCIVSAILIVIVIDKSVLRPLTNLQKWIQEVSHDKNYSLRIEIESNDEVGIISSELNHMLSIIEENHQSLEKLTLVDPLTGIPNRLALENKLRTEWNTLRRYEHHLAVLMIDIDYFKLFNDHYGHQQGDVCIKTVAKTINNCLKRSNDMVARFGGEEFVVVLPGHDSNTANQIAKLIQTSIRDKNIEHMHSSAAQRLTLSIGISSVIPSANSSVEALIQLADAALYRAKQAGRNCIKIAKTLDVGKEST